MISIEFSTPTHARQTLLIAAEYFSEFTGTTLLLSNGGKSDGESFLFLFPYRQVILSASTLNPWEALQKEIGDFNALASEVPQWSGYFGYEMGAYSDKEVRLSLSPSPYPLAYFQKSLVKIKQSQSKITLWIEKENESESIEQKEPLTRYLSEKFWRDFLTTHREFSSQKGSVFDYLEQGSSSSYCDQIERAKEFIRSGDVYQVNLSRSVTFKTDLPSFEIFKRLSLHNPTPFSAFLNLGSFEILSISPEKFLSHRKGLLETRPIKGTIARNSSPLLDEEAKQKLLQDPKEDAELMMICDLMRNDLGQISKIGSVHCPMIKHLLTLSNLYHLESIVRGEARSLHPIEYIRHCFPAGSITGCPKIRSMQIIHLLEKRARHIYCGSIGYLCENGDFNFNVAIRTAVRRREDLELQIGGAITYDSHPEKEYEETKAKAASFNQILLKSPASL